MKVRQDMLSNATSIRPEWTRPQVPGENLPLLVALLLSASGALALSTAVYVVFMLITAPNSDNTSKIAKVSTSSKQVQVVSNKVTPTQRAASNTLSQNAPSKSKKSPSARVVTPPLRDKHDTAKIHPTPRTAFAKTLSDCPPQFTIYFRYSTKLKRPYTGPLGHLRSWLKRHPDVLLILNGYADAVGDASDNFKLSRKRAAKIKRWLKKAGIPSQQMLVRAFGEFSTKAKQAQAKKERKVTFSFRGSYQCLKERT